MFGPLARAWRILTRDLRFSILNIAGLSTGIACALLIYLWVQDEKSMDNFHEHRQQLYQVLKNAINDDGTIDTHESTPGMLAGSMKNDFPEIDRAVSVVKERQSIVIRAGNKPIKVKGYYASDDFFRVFTYPLLEGSTDNALKQPNEIYISDKLATALFNKQKGIRGSIVEWNSGDEMSGSYAIAGVFKSPPANSSEQFDAVLPFSHYFNTFREKYGLDKWYSNNPSTYILLKPGTDANAFNKKIKEYSRQKLFAAIGADALKWEGDTFIQRYADKYLHNQYENGKIAGGKIVYVTLFTIIAIIIIFLACINFMNLSTAQATARIKDAGIRKLVGASRLSLIVQFVGQSTFLAAISGLLAVLMVYLLLPEFSLLINKLLSLQLNAQTIFALAVIVMSTGIIAGSYPSIYLSSFRPANVLKSNIQLSGGHAGIRRSLVVVQFTLSVIFIVAVMIIYRQMNLIRSKNLGFEKHHIIAFSSEGKVYENENAFLDELRNIPGVVYASGMEGNMTGEHSGGGGINWERKGDNAIEFDGFDVNKDWIRTFNIQLAEGRAFSGIQDSTSVLFNETAIRMMKLKNPVGRKVNMWGKEKTIIGVVKDFHYESLYRTPGPLFLRYSSSNPTLIARLAPSSAAETINRIKQMYTSFNGGLPFDFHFIDDDFDRLYASEQRTAVLSKYFAGLAVLISCLGLFGLSAFTVQKRQKEIGIRKVLGASVAQLAALLTRSFMKLITWSLLIAFPLSWWLMNEWLSGFAYRIKMGADIFILTGVAVFAITIATISFQSLRSAFGNPVDSLRTE